MKAENMYLGDWKFYRRALAIALPVMLQQMIQNLVSLIDNFMVAGLGDVCMSGVNVSNQVLFVFMIFLNTICISGGIYLTQNYGAKNKEGMQQAFRFKLIAGLFALIPYFLVCIVFPREVLSLMLIGNTDAPAILDQGVLYIRLMFFMGIQMTVSMCIATSLRDMGQVRMPLVISVSATLVNTFLNWVLIYGHLGAPRMEVRGAAAATIIARTFELILYLAVLHIKHPDFAFRPHEFLKIKRHLFGEILAKSGMVLISEMTWVISETIMTALYNGRGGADVVSGMAASFALANIVFVGFSGTTNAINVILGSTLGAGHLEEARKQKNWLLTGCFIVGLVMILVSLATILLIPVVFGNLSPEARHITRSMMIMLAIFMPPWVLVVGQLAVSRAGGDTAMGAYVDAGMIVFINVPLMFILALTTDIGPVALYSCVRALDMGKIFVFEWWLRKEKWLRNLAEPGEGQDTAKEMQ